MDTQITIPLEQFIRTLNKICDYQDVDTKDHSRRTRDTATAIGELMGFQGEELMYLGYGADIHDVGKLSIEAIVLRQAAKLTHAQRSMMNNHCQYGVDIVKYVNMPKIILDCILYHQEHYDGSGYPHSLVGEQIPLAARIVCISDVWDAIRCDRPYRTAMSPDKAVSFMNKNARWFDPEVFALWLHLYKENLV